MVVRYLSVQEKPAWRRLLVALVTGVCLMLVAGRDYSGETVVAQSVVTSCPAGQFLAEYYNNRTLSGSATFTRCEASINYDWGDGGPGNGVGPDNFSVRWTGRPSFAAGTYTFNVQTDDGHRVWLDGVLLFDRWQDQGATLYQATRTLTAGPHEIKVEYYENQYGATARFWWQGPSGQPTATPGSPTPTAAAATPTPSNPTPTPSSPTPTVGSSECPAGQFLAEYYNNRTLSGSATFTRCEASINYDWGDGGPGNGVGPDNFSVRWTGRPSFAAGTYTFNVQTDDGHRVWLDGVLLFDRWQDQGATLYQATRTLTAGPHEIKVEYYENQYGATARFWWQGPSGQPTATPGSPTPTAATATPTPSNPTPTPSSPTPTLVPATATPVGGGTAQPRLVARYALKGSNTQATTRYQPGQFRAGLSVLDEAWGPWQVTDPGPYSGWDLLALPDQADHRYNTDADYAVIRLHRAATVAVVWRDSARPGGTLPPSWLSTWTPGGTITTSGQFAGTLPVFRRVVPAGDLVLPGPATGLSTCCGVNSYWLLFGEATGTASPPPAVPSGLPLPQPNQTCPSWVHDQYVTTGPDGRRYPTWHPQIDPVYWCYFRHEHGSDPAYFDPAWQPPFGYAAQAGGENEAHPGFKVYVLEDTGFNGYRWAFVHHFGTANAAAAACNRFHEVQVAVKHLATNTLVAHLQFLGDHGAALAQSGRELTPSACPTQAGQARAAGSQGQRLFPVEGDAAFAFYEPWQIDLARTVLGFTFSGLSRTLSFNTTDVITICPDYACNTPRVVAGHTGTHRFVTYSNGGLVASGASSGVFYTDAYGQQLVSPTTPGAVRQYLQPGLSVQLKVRGDDETCEDYYAWGQPLVCASLAEHSRHAIWPTVREASVQSPN